MSKATKQQLRQLGFDQLLVQAEQDNRTRISDRQTPHLAVCMDQAVPFFRTLIEHHHAAMPSADIEQAIELRKQAQLLAKKINGGNPGILAHDDAPGCVLGTKTATLEGEVALWGPSGTFETSASGISAQIEMEGVFGIGASHLYCLGFYAHAVEFDQPFLSSRGYRSFLGASVDPQDGLTPETFTQQFIEAYVETELKGRLEEISPRHRPDQTHDEYEATSPTQSPTKTTLPQ